MEPSILALWTLAFTLGILHAFDADHVLAVSAMGRTQPSKKMTLLFCRNWAIGHGFTLILVSMTVLLMGLSIPTQISAHAETAVALVIILLAVVLLINVSRKDSSQKDTFTNGSRNGAVAVGVLHGLAGTAPFLTVIPLTQLQSSWSALIYLLAFSAGVVLAMVLFGGVLNTLYKYIANKNLAYLKVLRLGIAICAFTVGCIMLVNH